MDMNKYFNKPSFAFFCPSGKNHLSFRGLLWFDINLAYSLNFLNIQTEMFLSIGVFSEHIQSACYSFQEQKKPPLPERDNNLTRNSSS